MTKLAPQVKREAIGRMIEEHHLSERRSCRLVGLSRDSYRHPPQPDAQTTAPQGKIVAIVLERESQLGCRGRRVSVSTTDIMSELAEG